jgi:hypothetical protein
VFERWQRAVGVGAKKACGIIKRRLVISNMNGSVGWNGGDWVNNSSHKGMMESSSVYSTASRCNGIANIFLFPSDRIDDHRCSTRIAPSL